MSKLTGLKDEIKGCRTNTPMYPLIECIEIDNEWESEDYIVRSGFQFCISGAYTKKWVQHTQYILFRDPAQLNLTISVRLSGHTKWVIKLLSQSSFPHQDLSMCTWKRRCLLHRTNHRHGHTHKWTDNRATYFTTRMKLLYFKNRTTNTLSGIKETVIAAICRNNTSLKKSLIVWMSKLLSHWWLLGKI